MNPFINASNTTFDLIPFLDFFREDCLHFRLACHSTNSTMHLNVVVTGLLLLLVIICTSHAGDAKATGFDPIPRPRTFFTGFGSSNNDASATGATTGQGKSKHHKKHNNHDSNSKLTVSKYSVSGRGTRYRRDTVIDTAQIESPLATRHPPLPISAPVSVPDLEPSATVWPFSYLFGQPSRRRVVVSRRGRPYGTYRRKGWWPAGSAVRDAWW